MDTNPVELGVKFRTDAGGDVLGIRFWKSVADTALHTGSLWTSDGKLLATGTFANESASGWQQLNFTSPVTISPFTTYIASYHTSSGFMLARSFFQGQGYDNGVLHALQSGVDGPNGVYVYGAGGAFPNQSYSSSSYFVDIAFAPSSTAGHRLATIFGASAPNSDLYRDDPVELGIKFRSDTSGNVTGVRFYKGTGDTSTHTGSLWTSKGQLLATGTFTGESASGWQTLTFATPVGIAANTTYIASYHTGVGFIDTQLAFVNSGVDNGPLHLLKSGVDGPNSVFRYGPGGVFPTDTYLASNYWVDVVFSY